MSAAGVRDPLESIRWGAWRLISLAVPTDPKETFFKSYGKVTMNEFTQSLDKVPYPLAVGIVETLVYLLGVVGKIRPVLGHHSLEF